MHRNQNGISSLAIEVDDFLLSIAIIFIDMVLDRKNIGGVASIVRTGNLNISSYFSYAFLMKKKISYFKFNRCQAKCIINERTGVVSFENINHNHGLHPKRVKRRQQKNETTV